MFYKAINALFPLKNLPQAARFLTGTRAIK